jgi:hypothetical protein
LQHEIHMHSIEREDDMSFVGLLEYTGILGHENVVSRTQNEGFGEDNVSISI